MGWMKRLIVTGLGAEAEHIAVFGSEIVAHGAAMMKGEYPDDVSGDEGKKAVTLSAMVTAVMDGEMFDEENLGSLPNVWENVKQEAGGRIGYFVGLKALSRMVNRSSLLNGQSDFEKLLKTLGVIE